MLFRSPTCARTWYQNGRDPAPLPHPYLRHLLGPLLVVTIDIFLFVYKLDLIEIHDNDLTVRGGRTSPSFSVARIDHSLLHHAQPEHRHRVRNSPAQPQLFFDYDALGDLIGIAIQPAIDSHID